MKKAVGILVVVAVAIFAGAALAQMTGPGKMGPGMGWDYFGPGMTLGMMFFRGDRHRRAGGGHQLAGAPGARLTPQ